MFIRLALALLITIGGITAAANPHQAIPQRVLFVGNSYLYYNDSLHNHVERMAAKRSSSWRHDPDRGSRHSGCYPSASGTAGGGGRAPRSRSRQGGGRRPPSPELLHHPGPQTGRTALLASAIAPNGRAWGLQA